MRPNHLDTLITLAWGLTGSISCSEHFLNNYIQRETITFYTLISLSPNTWSKFISDSNAGLQLRHKAIGAVHFHSSSHIQKAIRTKPHHIWGNYKSQWWPRVHTVHETTVQLPVRCKSIIWHYTSLNSSQHYNMWILAPMKAWQAAWMAVPAAPLDPDELERRQRWSTNSSTVKPGPRTGGLSNPLISGLLLRLYIKTQRITLPSKMLGVLWSFGWGGYVEKFS